MTGYCIVTFTGLNVAATLCKLSPFGVFDFDKIGKNCSIKVRVKNLRKVLSLLDDGGFSVIDVKYVGLAAVLQFFKRHFVLPIALILVVAACAVLPAFCLSIDVGGDFDASAVVAALAQEGIKTGVNFSGFNADKLENALCIRLDAMYVTVKRSGCKLSVCAYKKRAAEDTVNLRERRDLVSSVKGQVVGILCEQGNAVVKIGDEVNVGDVLIEGKRIFADETVESVYASGRVKIKAQQSGFAPFCGYTVQSTLSGRTKSVGYVKLFGKIYAKSSPFENFQTEVDFVKLSPLNLEVGALTYREVVQTKTPCTVYDVLTDLQSQALCSALDGCDFTPVETVYQVSDKGVTATVFGYVYCY